MDLTEKIRTAFTNFLRNGSVPVVKVTPVSDRVLVTVVSRAFVRQSPLKRQQLIRKILHAADSPLSPADHERIGLVRPFTPKEANDIIQYRRARRAQLASGSTPDKVSDD